MNNKPLILLHYGDSDYLKYTLKNAIEINSDKTVILIGDNHNEKYKSLGLKHCHFEDYIDKEYLNEFKKCYRFVGGKDATIINERKRNVGKDYTEYNFLKWRVLYNFCKRNEIKEFWTFDTDVVYTIPLSEIEYLYKSFDYTTQDFKNNTIQGLINDVKWIRKFSETVLAVFNDHEYLRYLENNDFTVNPAYALTMVRMSGILKDRENPKIFNLQNYRNDMYLDASITTPFHKEEFQRIRWNNKAIKRIFIDANYRLLHRNVETNEMVEFFACNLSWIPLYVIKTFVKAVKNKRKIAPKTGLKEIIIKPSIWEEISFLIRKVPQKIKYEVQKRRQLNM